MNKCAIQLETREGVILVFAIDVPDIETILSIDHVDGALEIVFEGEQLDHELFEGDVFFDYHSDDVEEEAVNMQGFQQALLEWINDNEVYA